VIKRKTTGIMISKALHRQLKIERMISGALEELSTSLQHWYWLILW